MPRVTFYLLTSETLTLEHFTCRLTDKIWQSGLAVHIHTNNLQLAEVLDKQLWRWREDSFLPHEISHPEQPSTAPITLGSHCPDMGQSDKRSAAVLINLGSELPEYYAQFQRVCEIVPNQQQAKEATEIARKKYRLYKNIRIKPETHQVG